MILGIGKVSVNREYDIPSGGKLKVVARCAEPFNSGAGNRIRYRGLDQIDAFKREQAGKGMDGKVLSEMMAHSFRVGLEHHLEKVFGRRFKVTVSLHS